MQKTDFQLPHTHRVLLCAMWQWLRFPHIETTVWYSMPLATSIFSLQTVAGLCSVVLLCLVLMLGSGCTRIYKQPSPTSERVTPPIAPPLDTHEPIAPSLPDTIQIALTIEAYTIVRHRIITDINPLLHLKLSGQYTDGNFVYFKLDAAPPRECFWLLRVSPIQNGEYTADAPKICQQPDPASLPNMIQIEVEIRNARIQYHRVIDFGPYTFGLALSGVRDTSDGRVGVLTSALYEGKRWEVLFPQKDGLFILRALRVH